MARAARGRAAGSGEGEGELACLQTQHAELQQRQNLAAFELADGELADVMAAMRADVRSDETPVARRALSLFVRRVDVDADRLVIWYHEPDLVECTRLQTVPSRGFGLKPSTTRPVSWQRAWALAAAWREQLGEGDAGAGRGGRGRVGRVGSESGAWARVVTAY